MGYALTCKSDRTLHESPYEWKSLDIRFGRRRPCFFLSTLSCLEDDLSWMDGLISVVSILGFE